MRSDVSIKSLDIDSSCKYDTWAKDPYDRPYSKRWQRSSENSVRLSIHLLAFLPFYPFAEKRRKEKKREKRPPLAYTHKLSPDREIPRRCVSSCWLIVLARVVFLLTTESISADEATVKFNDVNSGPAGNPYRYETIVLKCDYLGRECKIEPALIRRQSLSLEVN